MTYQLGKSVHMVSNWRLYEEGVLVQSGIFQIQACSL